MGKINIYDMLRVVASSRLSSDDIEVLSLLYQPLIGNDGFALYFALINLVDRQKMTSCEMMHKELLDILNLKIQGFEIARNKLEALGLLRTLKSEKDYVYFINMPLSAKVFMSGELGPFLYTKLGDALFKKLYNSFVIEKIDRTNYIEVTHNFDDVFESNSVPLKNDELLKERKTGIIQISNANFDMDSYINGMKSFVDRRRITEAFRQSILRLAYTYGFNYQDMINVSMSAYNGEKIDMTLLKKKARDYYSEISKRKTPDLVLKETTEASCDDEKLNLVVNTTPKEILESISGMGAAVSELALINEIWEKTGWDKGIINAFVLFIMKKKDGKLPSLNYLDRVANEWKRMGIDTAWKALEYLESGGNNPNDSQAKEEDWLDEWYKKVGEIKYE